MNEIPPPAALTWSQRASAWVAKWWGILVAGVVLFLVMAGVWQRRTAQLGAARDAAAVAEARREMDALRAQRIEVTSRVDAKTEEIVTLDTRIAESKRRIVELHEGGANVPDDQLDATFASLGY